MKLLYPEYLWGLLALSIPIIIHLFNFRKFQKVYFSSIDLLKEVKLETKSKSRLKHLIILILRLLALTALIFAFAQPYIPINQEERYGENVVSIFIDNSHSMDSKGVNGYRLELAKEQAEAIISNYGATDLFQVITNDFEGRHQRLYNKQEAIQLINEITPSFQSKTFSEIYSRQSDLLKNENANKFAYWLSDFQEYTCDFDQIEVDSSLALFGIPYENAQSQNLYIDSIWFETPVRKSGVEDKVHALVINEGEKELDFKLNLSINDNNQAFVNFTIAPGQKLKCEIPYTVHTNGVQHAELSLADYPDASLTFDDDYFFSYFIQPSVRILHLHNGEYMNDSSGYFGALYGTDPDFFFKNEQLSTFDFSTLSSFDLIILDDIPSFSKGLVSEMKSFYEAGGSICIYPSSNANIGSYNELIQPISSMTLSPLVTAQNKVSALNREHPLFDGIFETIPTNVDLPKVNLSYPIGIPSSSYSVALFTLQDGKPFIAFSSSLKGSVSICSSPLNDDATNWAKHALFVPTMLRIAEFSKFRPRYDYIIGEDITVDAPSTITISDNVAIQSTSDEFTFMPEVKITNQSSNFIVHDQIKSAGHYDVIVNEELSDGLAFNYSRDESQLNFLNSDNLTNALSNSDLNGYFQIISGADSSEGIELASVVNGKKYWWHLIIAALIFLALEIAVYRLFR
ncbi:MAG: BatA domain-containing protein [Flavobacteriales bacterium]|nr:BatA domain-containing protein [Flavobacteriales bacterium]